MDEGIVKEITPTEYFDDVKGRKLKTNDEVLKKMYDNAITLINKYKVTGQTKGLKRLVFQLDIIEKEREAVN